MNEAGKASRSAIALAIMAGALVGCATEPGRRIQAIFAPQPGEQALATGLKQYENGDYADSAKNLGNALDQGLGDADRVRAHKHLAFIHCASSRERQCRDEFRKALAVDPSLELSPAEAGHPTWGPVFRSLKGRRSPVTAAMEQPKLGRYLIDSELGRGAMGVVYKATDSLLERTVAVKTVNMALEKDGIDRYEQRFYQEAKAAGGLNHPNIVTVYDVGKAGDVAYMAMEFIDGVELRTLIGEGKLLPVSQCVSIAAQVAEGLAFAHQHGVVHRDIKPANIMVTAEGPVKITDFGIARMRASGELTQTGMMLGSPKYMSPEQVIGKRADHRSDIFSLGVILYEMLTGRAPFHGDNVTALMYQIVNFAPPAPSALNGAVPELLDYVVAKMLSKALDERYPEAQQAARDLRECERQLAGPVTPTLPPRPAVGLAPGPQPELVDTGAQSVVLAQTVNRTRQADEALDEATQPPARGLAHSFDSLEATQRLASLTGALAAPPAEDPQTATQLIGSLPRPARTKWRRRDWLVVGGAGLLGLILASSLFRRK